jgi:hypothetical protein
MVVASLYSSAASMPYYNPSANIATPKKAALKDRELYPVIKVNKVPLLVYRFL